MNELAALVTEFVASCKQPALLDSGEEPLRLLPDSWTVTEWNGRSVLQAWDDRRNLVRRIVGVKERRRDRIIFTTERFPKSAGEMQICDMAAPDGRDLERRSSRAAFRESFRLMLAREYPAWTIDDLSVEPNLEQSLSPAYVRSLLRMGPNGIAAMAAPPGCAEPSNVVAFGLIWLAYLKRREPGLSIGTLLLFAESAAAQIVVSRARWIRTDAVRCVTYLFDERERAWKAEEWSEGNVGAALPPCHHPNAPNSAPLDFPTVSGVDSVEQGDGSIRMQVKGLEFAVWKQGKFSAGIGRKKRSTPAGVAAMARELLRVRAADCEDRQHPLYLQRPEGWMESQVRAHPEAIDPCLLPLPLYGQVPVAAASDRGIADLLGVDNAGRLAVIELKASADIHLPFQALDYWARIVRHLQAGDFERLGYFPNVRLLRDKPIIYLVAPALEFHSTSETLLSYLHPGIEIMRVGLAADWRRELRVMFRLSGADRPF